MKETYDSIVVGCGFAGAVVARELAERHNMRVLILEKRNHVGGNAYDGLNEDGILVHYYGPHIFHSYSKRVYDYLSRFTQWREYSHEVLANVCGQLIPVPFNLNSLRLVFDKDKASIIEKALISVYGAGRNITINELMNHSDYSLREVADYVFQNVFRYYTQKQWGISVEDIDPSVSARVPIRISRDNRYFQDTYQGVPLAGYTSLFNNMLNHPKVDIQLNTDAAAVLNIDNNKIYYQDKIFTGIVVYTGAVDELFGCCFERLPYRSLDFKFETYDKTWYQKAGTVNYTVDKEYSRITEFKYLTGQNFHNKTTILKEYPRQYLGTKDEIPYYAILNRENLGLYSRYEVISRKINNFYLLGRLAEYKYYNMDTIIERALCLVDNIICKKGDL